MSVCTCFAGTLGPSVSSDPAIVEMIANLKGLPSARIFGTEFHMFQSNELQLMSCYRPSAAKVIVYAITIAI